MLCILVPTLPRADHKDKLDLAFNNVKPKDWYFVIDLVQLRKGSGCVTLRGWSIKLNSRLGYFILVHFTRCISKTWNWKSSIRILFCQRSRQIEQIIGHRSYQYILVSFLIKLYQNDHSRSNKRNSWNTQNRG